MFLLKKYGSMRADKGVVDEVGSILDGGYIFWFGVLFIISFIDLIISLIFLPKHSIIPFPIL